MDLTVGQVSGIIAAGVVVVKIVLPTLCAFLFIGTLQERNSATTTSAVSWSSIGRLLHSSYWPTILSSDSAALSGVPFIVLFFRYAGMLCTMLISIAAIVTPLGLYESMVPGHPEPEQFHHIQDEGIFGTGTPRRNDSVTWSRICGGLSQPFTCPDLTRPLPSTNRSIDRSIPQETIDLFTSGSASSNSLSSIFDIQWRMWSWTQLLATNQTNATNTSLSRDSSYQEPYPIGIFRQISTLALEDRLEVVDGLVIDAKHGGVGFRNHSAPRLTVHGSTWSEDLLFIQPVTSCVDTNLTLNYAIPENDVLSFTMQAPNNMTVIDRGGFSQLNTTYPEWDRTDVQTNPQLWARAYQAAWLSNVFAMSKYGISNVTVSSDSKKPLAFHGKDSLHNQSFPISRTVPNRCWIDRSYTGTIAANPFGCYAANASASFPEDDSLDATPSKIRSLCEATEFDASLGNIGHIATYCALIFGASQRLDSNQDDDLPFHVPGTAWYRPMYSCAMAVEATIKTVTFTFNTTDNLNGLTVLDIADMEYNSEIEYPLWGVENLVNITHSWTRPLWGLVSREAAENFSRDHLQTVQKPSLFLPLTGGYGFTPESQQNLPGVEFYGAGFGVVDDMYYSSQGLTDYTGSSNLAMSQRWNKLSKSAESMTTALNLVWTDYAANAVVGTKGSPSSGGSVYRPVRTYRTAIRYELAYAIPALAVLAILLLASFLSFVVLLFDRASLPKMKRYLNATSSGRIMASMLQPLGARGIDNDTPTGEWIRAQGKVGITAGKSMPAPVLVPVLNNAENSALLKGPVVGQEPLRM
ncbi:hypothetical protein BJY04DRAFT_231725 [Aspergillus karnatakaensis]|uniref:uncharacterized protein n=1 Tax=Aspergillus karnatakaensis TaxID=1810916 RepID=UPI003CCD15A9